MPRTCLASCQKLYTRPPTMSGSGIRSLAALIASAWAWKRAKCGSLRSTASVRASSARTQLRARAPLTSSSQRNGSAPACAPARWATAAANVPMMRHTQAATSARPRARLRNVTMMANLSPGVTEGIASLPAGERLQRAAGTAVATVRVDPSSARRFGLVALRHAGKPCNERNRAHEIRRIHTRRRP